PPPQTSPLSLHAALPIFCTRCLGISYRGYFQRVDDTLDKALTDFVWRDNEFQIARSCLVVYKRCQYLHVVRPATAHHHGLRQSLDRKSTRLNSSHVKISY